MEKEVGGLELFMILSERFLWRQLTAMDIEGQLSKKEMDNYFKSPKPAAIFYEEDLKWMANALKEAGATKVEPMAIPNSFPLVYQIFHSGTLDYRKVYEMIYH